MTTEPAPNQEMPPMVAAFVENPYPMLEMLRQTAPVFHEPLGNRYLLTRHDDVVTALRGPAFLQDPRQAAEGTFGHTFAQNALFAEEEAIPMLFLDPPAHTRLRGLVSKAFTPRAVEAMRPRARALAATLLAEAGERFDIIATLAAPLPTLVIAEMIGVDPARRDEFKAWSDALVNIFNPFATAEQQAARDAARAAIHTFFIEEIDHRRTAPRDDLISGLIAAQEAGDRLTDTEMSTMLQLLLVAGNVTTTDLIGNGVYALITNPQQYATLQADRGLLVNAVEEMLRYDSPVTETGRVPSTEVSFPGGAVAARQSITPSLAAANHDPAVFPNAGAFDITRENVKHHSFGGGRHMCLGAPLARVEAQEAFAALLDACPSLRLAADAKPQRRLLPGFRGFTSLVVERGA